MGILSGIRQRLSATDPGRQRLNTATAVSVGIALSALASWAVVSLLHADHALLTVGIFLAMQMGLVAKDSTAKGRWVTTAWLAVPAIGAATAATLLHSVKWQQLVLFVLIAGVGTWVRRFGPRATAMGFAAFFGYFFAVLLGLTLVQLPFFALVVLGAAGAQTLMRLLLSIERPLHRIEVLLQELRSVSAAALSAASHAPEQTHDVRRWRREQQRTLRDRLARLDATAFAIADWQQEFDTQQVLGCDPVSLSTLVLEVRMDVEHVCAELEQDPESMQDVQVAGALHDLRVVLQHTTAPAAITEATQRAREHYAAIDSTTAHRALLGSITRSSLAHQQLRSLTTAPAHTQPALGKRSAASHSAHAAASSTPTATSAPAPATPHTESARWWQWRQWRPTTRLALQIMIAAALATIAGEAISASRWYWAVLTAFIVFVGTTTRGDILTRAYRRIAGTVGGLIVGVLAVWIAHDHRPALVIICVVAAFGMQYLGPVRYFYSTFFISIMLVSLYGLLGVLDTQVLELRIDETAVGAIIGVLCAYLIFSANSHPALLGTLAAYFAAFRSLAQKSQSALTEHPNDRAVLATLQHLDDALRDLDKKVSAMSAAVLISGRTRQEPNVHLLYLCTRASAGLAQSTVAATRSDGQAAFQDDAAVALLEAFAHLGDTADNANASFTTRVQPVRTDTVILDLLPRIPFGAEAPQVSVVTDLSRMNWVLLQIIQKNNG